jgi:hypothetical protein
MFTKSCKIIKHTNKRFGGFGGEITRNETIWKDPGVDGRIKWLLNRMGQCGRN